MQTTVPQWILYLVEAARQAPSADNSQPWRFVYDGQVLALEFDQERAGVLGRKHPAVLMGMGAVIENMVQAARDKDLDIQKWSFTCTDDRRLLEIPMTDVGVKDSFVLPPNIRERHTNRGPFKPNPLPEKLLERLRGLCEDGCGVRIFSSRKSVQQIARLVQKSSELRFRTKEIHLWLADSLRFTEEEIARCDGLDVNTLFLPPGGKALSRFLSDWRRMSLLNKFGAYRLLAGFEASQLKHAGAVVAVVGRKIDFRSWISVGRLMERIWLELNSVGLAVHPYFVLSDQLYRQKTGQIPSSMIGESEMLVKEAEDLFGPGKTPLILLRIGKAKKQARRSCRLPMEILLKTVN